MCYGRIRLRIPNKEKKFHEGAAIAGSSNSWIRQCFHHQINIELKTSHSNELNYEFQLYLPHRIKNRFDRLRWKSFFALEQKIQTILK